MKRSESWCSSWSARIISAFSMTSTVVGAIEVAVAMQTDWPARHPSPKKIAASENRYNGFFAGLIDYSKPHTAFLNVHDILGGIALREDGFFSSKRVYLSAQTGGVEK